MANHEVPTMQKTQFRGSDDSDISSGVSDRGLPKAQHGAPPARPASPAYARTALAPGEGQFVNEVMGDPAAPWSPPAETTAEAGVHEEVANYGGAEAGEEYFEATPEQLAAESDAESAVSDLRNLPGYESSEGAEEGAAAPVELPLREVGEAAAGVSAGEAQEEFLPILAALAPTLISTIGPAVAKGVMSKLSPRAKNAIKRLPKAAAPVVGAAAKIIGGGGKTQILSLIAKLLETAETQPGGESGTEVDATFVNETAAVLELILGSDDRVRIMPTTQIPWRRICALRITFPSGATYRGSGFLIGPRAVATAGHCVYLHNQGGWARRVEVIPGCNGSVRPYGEVVSSSFRSVGGWVSGKKPESDYGCIVLPSGAFGGQNLGSFGFASFPAARLLAEPAVLAGYPGDKPFAELWGMARKIKTVTAKTLIYDIDTMGGQSGAPVYIKINGQRYVVGIHNYGATTGNSATRVTQEVYERLLAWSKL